MFVKFKKIFFGIIGKKPIRILSLGIKYTHNGNNYEHLGHKSCRLPFGLRCSSAILMLALYKMFFLISENNDTY